MLNFTLVHLFQLVHSKEYQDAQTAAPRSQPSLSTFGVTGGAPYTRDGVKHQALTNQLVKAVADGYLPLALVDLPSFRKLVEMLDPR